MVADDRCAKCPVRWRATDFLLLSIGQRRGMSLQDARTLLLVRFGFTYVQTETLVSELRKANLIQGSAKRFTIAGQRGGGQVG